MEIAPLVLAEIIRNLDKVYFITIHELENFGKYKQNSKLYMLQKYLHNKVSFVKISYNFSSC